jgi:hypothetical protein
LSRNLHFEIVEHKNRMIVKTYKLHNAGISLIEYNNLNELVWNDSFDRLAEHLENEIKWGNNSLNMDN